jgi:psp operon transcriptional activator
MSVGNPDLPALIGESPAFVEMLEHVSLAARMTKPVLVIGERGTGKELIAARLHYLSERWEQRLLRVNCAALTETLLESELFGHEAGAFTGAAKAHVGCFEQADGGTLVLDELGTIPARMQEKILRVIEYGEFRRVGGSKTLRSDARIVGSTNEHLPALVEQGAFRADLLDRLAFDVIRVPPLRERPEDILTLAQHFAVNMTAELQRAFFAGFSAAVEAELLAHQWPGNVRELKNTVERSLYRMADPEALLESLIFDPFGADDTTPAQTQASKLVAEKPALPVDFRAAVRDYETGLIEAALEAAQFRQTAAAEMLGLSYHQLRGLLKKYSLPRGGK